MDKKGSSTLENAIVVPLLLLFIAAFLLMNIKFFNLLNVPYETLEKIDYVNLHREISSIFDAGGDIFEMLFGE